MKRLIIALDKRISLPTIYEDDIVLTQDFKYYSANHNLNKVLLADFLNHDEGLCAANGTNELFSKLPERYMVHRNTFYAKIFRPVYSVIAQIEEIVQEENIEEIVLIGGSMHIFLTSYFGEGEGKHRLYRSSWLLNPVIYRYFKKRIPVRWLQKTPKWLMASLNSFRENLFLTIDITKKVLLSLFNRSSGKDLIQVQTDNKLLVFIVNLELQYRHLSSLFSENKGVRKVFIGPRWMKHEDLISCIPLSIKEVLKIIAEINDKRKYRTDIELSVFDCKINFPNGAFFRSLRLREFNYRYKYCELNRILNMLQVKEDTWLVTDMTYGEDIILCNELCKIHRLFHVNFQHVAMSQFFLPQMELADKYYLYSVKTYEFYRRFSNSYHFYSPLMTTPISKQKHTQALVLTLFTQPDKYTERYIELLDNLLPRIENSSLDVKVLIKPHYRQDRLKEFESIVSRFSFALLVSKEASPEDLIRASDMVLSMTSSVLFESLVLGRMAVIIDIDGLEKDFIYSNDTCFPEVNLVATSIDKIIDIIANYPNYLKQYEERRITFLHSLHNNPQRTDIYELLK